MYKQKNKARLEQSKCPVLWVKRKIMLLITAFLIGMSNGMNDRDHTINGNQNHTEQLKKD